MRRISENDALARVSARFSRSQGLQKSLIFDGFWGTDFRCLFRTLFFRVLVIFSDFWAPSGLPFGDHWHENWGKKSTFCRRAPRRVPGRDLAPILGGFGRYFCVFLTLCLMFFWVSFSIACYMGAWSRYSICINFAWAMPGICVEHQGMCRELGREHVCSVDGICMESFFEDLAI